MYLSICYVQWQELSAEVEEHQRENLALCDKIKRSRQAITAEIIEQRRIKRSFHDASAQLNKRIRYSSCSHSLKCMRKIVLFVTRSSEGHPTASGQWLSIRQHVPLQHRQSLCCNKATLMLRIAHPLQLHAPLPHMYCRTSSDTILKWILCWDMH